MTPPVATSAPPQVVSTAVVPTASVIDFSNPLVWVFLGAAALAVTIPKSNGVKVALLGGIGFLYYELGKVEM